MGSEADIRLAAKALVGDLWHEAQTERMYQLTETALQEMFMRGYRKGYTAGFLDHGGSTKAQTTAEFYDNALRDPPRDPTF